MRVRQVVCLAVATAAIAGLVMKGSHAQEVSSADESFMKNAAQAGHYEIEAARLSLELASNPNVKAFAQMMLDEHRQIASELSALAQSKGVELPDRPSLMQRGKLTLLKGKKGREFDKDYAEHAAVTAHEDTIKLFDKYLTEGRDKEVMGFAQDALPMLQQHLRHAHVLQEAIQGEVAR
ncbi:MAG: DUF4142 domain-containing protein [Pigmentiphaga sp.]|nr:DUF4142 domain-containing protein [Pigmentiphaga sp.]